MGRGATAALFTLAVGANLAWLLTSQGKGLLSYVLFNLALMVGVTVLLGTTLALSVVAAQKAEAAGALGLARRLYALAGALAAAEGRVACRVNQMGLAVREDDHEAADRLWAAIEPDLHLPGVCATWARSIRAASLVNRGRLAESLEVSGPVEETERVQASPLFPMAESLRLNNRASALRELGRFEEARRCLEEAAPRAAAHPAVQQLVRLNLVTLDFDEGRREEAVRQAREAVPAEGGVERGWALLLARAGHPDEAERLLARPAGPACPDSSLLGRYVREMTLGFVAAARGRPEEAAARFDAAAALPVPPGAEMIQAATLVEEGERYRRVVAARNPESEHAR